MTKSVLMKASRDGRVMDRVAMLTVFARPADAALGVRAKSLRSELFTQPVSGIAVCFGFADFAAFLSGTVVSAIRGGITEFMDVSPLCWRGVPRGSKSGRRHQQRQGDNEMFHANSLEAISVDVKRAA